MKHHNPHILEGSLTKGVITLSTPIIFSMFFQSLLNIVDTFWLGRLGAEAVAAVSVSWPIIFIVIALASGVSIGCNALVAKYYGAKDLASANQAAENSIWLGAFLALFLTIIGFFVSPSLFRFIGVQGEVYKLALIYTDIIFVGTAFVFLMFILGAILRGEGDTKTAMKIAIGINVVNFVLDPVLIFLAGWGVAGAAVATVIANILGLVAFLVFFQTHEWFRLRFRGVDFNLKQIKDILFIGVPASLRNVSNAIGTFFITKIIAGYGAAAVAAYGIGFRLDSLGVLPVVAISSAAVTMVGQNFGAGNYQRAKNSGWISSGLGLVLLGVIGMLTFIFAPWLINIFTGEKEVIDIGSTFLRIRTPGLVFSAVIMTLSAAFQAFHKSHYSFILTLLRVISMIVMAYWFNDLFGLSGVWWAVTVSSIILAVAITVWYALYQPKEVEEKPENLL